MNNHNPQIVYSINRVIDLANTWGKYVIPNEPIDGYKVDDILIVVRNIPDVLSGSFKGDLIANVEDLISDLKLPTLDYTSGYREAILFRIKLVDLINELNGLSTEARSLGYPDPHYTAIVQGEFDLREGLKEVSLQIEEQRRQLDEIRELLKNNKRGIVSVGYGPVTIDAIEAASFIKKSLSRLRYYLKDTDYISGVTLAAKLQKIKFNSIKLLNSVAAASKNLENRIVELAAGIAKLATESLTSALQLLERVYFKIKESSIKQSAPDLKQNKNSIREKAFQIIESHLSSELLEKQWTIDDYNNKSLVFVWLATSTPNRKKFTFKFVDDYSKYGSSLPITYIHTKNIQIKDDVIMAKLTSEDINSISLEVYSTIRAKL